MKRGPLTQTLVSILCTLCVCLNVTCDRKAELLPWRDGNAFDPINEVTLRRAGLVLGWVTAWRQVNYLGM